MVFKTMEHFTLPPQELCQNRYTIWCVNTRSSSQNPRFSMERDQPAFRGEGHESKESDARQSAHGSTRSRHSQSSSRRLNQIQEAVLRQEVATQRSQDTLNNMNAMIHWQVNRQFRKDHEAGDARNPNPYAVVQQLELPFGSPPRLAWSYQENPLITQMVEIPESVEAHVEQRGRALVV